MDKLKVFISMPMDGKSKSEIDEAFKKESENVRDFIAEVGYKGKKGYDIECFSGYVELKENPNVRNSALNYLGASLQKLSEADVIWLGNGWANARGCKLEWICGSRYGMDVLNSGQVSDRWATFDKTSEAVKKAWEALYETPELKAKDEAWVAYIETPAYKAYEEAWEAVKKTPEYKDYDAAYEARKKACRAANEAKEAYDKACENLYGKDEALGEAEKAMHATPGYKAYDKAWVAYIETPAYKAYEEAWEALKATPEWKAKEKAEKAHEESTRRINNYDF